MAKILVAAIKVKTGALVALNRRHFIEDPEVARRSGLRIGLLLFLDDEVRRDKFS